MADVARVVGATGLRAAAVVAAVARTAEQAVAYATAAALVFGLLGGTFFPLSQAPAVLSFFSKLTPHAWFLQGLGDLSAGDGLSVVVIPTLAMLTFFVVTVGIAALVGRGRVLAP